MPTVRSKRGAVQDQLIDAFECSAGRSILRAAHGGISGNPVILPKAFYAQAMALQGDRGARSLIDNCDLDIVETDIGQAAIVDVDTQDDFQRLGGVPNAQ